MININTNVPSLNAQMHLQRSHRSLATSLERLSSGMRINRGADDPAGLIRSESLRSEIANSAQAVNNAQRASQVIATAEGALAEVSNMLIDIQDLIVEAANTGAMSDKEIRANQLQIDSAVDSITRVANTATFAGLSLLDGSLDYITSGIIDSRVANVEIYGAQFGSRTSLPVSVELIATASQAALYLPGSTIGSAVTLEIAGPDGVVTLAFGSGVTTANIAAAVNANSDATGVTAGPRVASNAASGIVFSSAAYGSDAFVSVQALTLGSNFTVTDVNGMDTLRDAGVDANVLVNGNTALADGWDLIVNTAAINMDLVLDSGFPVGSTTSFDVTGGGAMFQIGPDVNTNQQVSIGIRSVLASRLGNNQVGFLSQIVTGGEFSLIEGKAFEASRISNVAIEQVAVLRGRLGAFERNTLDTTVRSLEVTIENLTASESEIRDTDFASETAAYTRASILVNAGTAILAQANAMPQSVLGLLQ